MGEQYEGTIEKLQKEYALSPQEAVADMSQKISSVFIGLPNETDYQEKRISLTPNSVENLTANGHRVVMETGAADGSNFTDKEYTEAGAEIVYHKEEVFKAELVIKATPLNPQEIGMLQPHQIIFSPILLPKLTLHQLKSMMEKRVTAIAFEYVKGDYDTFPFHRSMGEIAGSYAILMAARYLSNEYGKGLLLGGITGHPPTKVVILGAGSVGLSAARAALGLGAQVQVFDNNISRLMRLQNDLGQKVYTSVLDYNNLRDKLSRAHVVVGAVKPIDGKTPCVVTEEMVAGMKEGSVIIDVSIDHGGCFATSRVTDHKESIFIKHGIIHYCVPNIASNVSRTASYALSNIISPIIKEASEVGGWENLFKLNMGLRHGVYLYKGALTKKFLSQKFNLKFTDLDLLMTANF